MKDSLENANPSGLNTQPTQLVMTNPTPVEPPSAWMQYGTSPTEIILATAVVVGATAGVIGSIALLLKVLVPVMQSNPSQKKE
jgi:hypothetical protein